MKVIFLLMLKLFIVFQYLLFSLFLFSLDIADYYHVIIHLFSICTLINISLPFLNNLVATHHYPSCTVTIMIQLFDYGMFLCSSLRSYTLLMKVFSNIIISYFSSYIIMYLLTVPIWSKLFQKIHLSFCNPSLFYNIFLINVFLLIKVNMFIYYYYSHIDWPTTWFKILINCMQ